MWPQKLNKLDDRRKSFNLKKGIGIESKKYENKLEFKKCGNKLKMELSPHRKKEREKLIPRHFLTLY